MAAGSRTAVFDVAGDIVLQDYLYEGGAFVTIDGMTAPPPGITLRNRGLIIAPPRHRQREDQEPPASAAPTALEVADKRRGERSTARAAAAIKPPGR